MNKEKVVGACCCEYFNIFFVVQLKELRPKKETQCEFNQGTTMRKKGMKNTAIETSYVYKIKNNFCYFEVRA